MTAFQKIRVLLVDDHHMVRMGIFGWIKKSADIEVVAEACNGAESISLFEQHQPDVVLMDRQLPDFEGIEATRRILAKCPAARIVVLSIDETEEAIHAAEQAGACGYLSKSLSRNALLGAIRSVAAGERHFRGEIGARLAERSIRVSLSPREREVLQLVAEGRANKEIGGFLGLSLSTVKNHLAHILQKLDAPDRTRAVTIALERGLLRR